MVEKKLGAEMDCGKCGTHVTCNEKTYAAYKDKPARTVLQWQNDDDTAHYKFNGKEYSCNIPEETDPDEIMLNPKIKEAQTTIQENATTSVLPVTLAELKDEIKFQREILQSILHIVADLKLQESKL